MKMPVQDEKRDKQFEKDVEKGLSITQLAGKYRVSKRQVSRLKKKLGLTTASTSTTKRMTFWLSIDMIEIIKKRAATKGKTCSAILREVLREYLKSEE